MHWQFTLEVIEERNYLNVLFVANNSQDQVTLLITAEFTVERNRTNVTCVTRHLVHLSRDVNSYIRIHSGDKPYKRSLNMCNSFSQSSNSVSVLIGGRCLRQTVKCNFMYV